MPVTESYMDAGDFTVAMGIETPHLMGTVQRGGFLIITPQYLGDPRGYTDTSLLAAARYTGVVLETLWHNGILTLEGAGLDWILGDRFSAGWPTPARNYSNAPLTTTISLIASGGIIPPALTIGTVVNNLGYTGTHTINTETIKQVITQIMAGSKAHYRINPNGSVDAGPVTTDDVFLNTPKVVMVRDGWGSDALWTGLPVRELESSVSIREWLSDHDPVLRGLTGTRLERINVDTSDPQNQPIGGMIEVNEIATDFTQISEHGSAMGDMVYIHDPGSGFIGDTTIWFRGRALRPAVHRIVETSTDEVEGMGFYYRPDQSTVDTDDWIDLTATVATVPAGSAVTYLRTLEASAEAGGCGG